MFGFDPDHEKRNEIAKTVLDDNDFRHVFDQLVKDTDQQLQAGIEAVPPTIIALMWGKNSERITAQAQIEGELPGDSDTKDALMSFLGAQLVKDSHAVPIAIFIAIEAWMWKGNDEESAFSSYKKHRDEDRQEVVVVSGQTVDGRCHVVIYSVNRDNDNNFVVIDRDEVSKNIDDGAKLHILDMIFEGASQFIQRNFLKLMQKRTEEIEEAIKLATDDDDLTRRLKALPNMKDEDFIDEVLGVEADEDKDKTQTFPYKIEFSNN